MFFNIVFLCQVLALQIGRVSFEMLFPHDKRLAFIQFDEKFDQLPQITISMIALHVNNEVPRSFGIEPKLLQITQQGFQLQVTNQKAKIDHLEYQWVAVLDDRIKSGCEVIEKTQTINFEREFWVVPAIQIFLAGFFKESSKNDLKFQLGIAKTNTHQFDLTLNNQSEHVLKNIHVWQQGHKMLLSQNNQQISIKKQMNLQIQKEHQII